MPTLIPDLGIETFSLADFQATRKRVENLCNVDGQDFLGFAEPDEVIPGFIYDGCCYIEELTDEQRAKFPALMQHRYHLIIERSEYTSDDLAELERILWADFYLTEMSLRPAAVSNVDGSLDDFIVGICGSQRAEVDGDLFGHLFSDIPDESGLLAGEAYSRIAAALKARREARQREAAEAKAAEAAVYFGA